MKSYSRLTGITALSAFVLAMTMAVASSVTACGSSRSAASSGASDGGVAGELMLSISSDMVWGQDLDNIDVEVTHHGRLQYATRLAATMRLPATVSLDAPQGDRDPIEIHLTGWKGSEKRVTRSAVTTLATGRAALLRLTLDWLCSAESGTPACPSETTCVLGACVDPHIDSATLPDLPANYLQTLPPCFDVESCFAQQTSAAPDPTGGCVIPSSGAASENVALVTSGDGYCVGSDCYVVVDHTFGWQGGAGAKLELPKRVCDDLLSGKIRKIAYSTTCPARDADQPICRLGEIGDGGAGGPQLLGTLGAGGAVAETVAVSGSYLYVARPSGLWRLPTAGGTAEQVVSDLAVARVRSAGGRVFVSVEGVDGGVPFGSIYRVDLSGPTTTAVHLFDTNSVTSLCPTPTRVFVLGQQGSSGTTPGAWHQDVSGGPVEFDAPSFPPGATPALGGCEGNAYFWIQPEGLYESGAPVDLRGHDVVTAAQTNLNLTQSGDTEDYVGRVVPTPDAFFAVLFSGTAPNLQRAIVTVPRPGGVGSTFLPLQEKVLDLAAAPGHLYALVQAGGSAASTRLIGSPTDHAAQFVIADTSVNPRAMAVDDQYLYYLSPDPSSPSLDRVYRLPHP